MTQQPAGHPACDDAESSPDLTLPAVLTTAEVARQLGCSDTHVARLIRMGELRTINIGLPGMSREYPRVRVADLADFIARRSGGDAASGCRAS